jgi:hypothetical protein
MGKPAEVRRCSGFGVTLRKGGNDETRKASRSLRLQTSNRMVQHGYNGSGAWNGIFLGKIEVWQLIVQKCADGPNRPCPAANANYRISLRRSPVKRCPEEAASWKTTCCARKCRAVLVVW